MTAGWDLGDELRLRAIREADLFAGVAEPTFEPYAKAIARLLDVPTALVSIVDDHQQFFPAQVGVAEPWATRGGTPLSMSFCQHVVRGDAPLVVVDATHDDRVAGNLAIDELDVMAYIGVPVRAPGGEPLGSVCAITSHPRQWTDDELAIVEEVAGAVGQLIAVRTSEHRWARFASEASHRLRTPVATAHLELEDLATWPTLDDEARAAVRSAADRTAELAAIVDELSTLAARQEQVGRSTVLVADLLEAALQAAGGGTVTGATEARVTTAATVLRSVLQDLLGVLRSADDGRIEVRIEAGDGQVRIALRGPSAGGRLVVPDAVRERVMGHLRGRVTASREPDGFELLLPT